MYSPIKPDARVTDCRQYLPVVIVLTYFRLYAVIVEDSSLLGYLKKRDI